MAGGPQISGTAVNCHHAQSQARQPCCSSSLHGTDLGESVASGHAQGHAANASPLICLPPQSVQYAVFGLGNKQYEHFNKMGRQVHKLMAQLGAVALVRAGEGDDDGSIDDDFDKWCAEFHTALDAKPDLLGAAQNGAGAAEPPAVVPAYEVQLAPAGSNAAPAFPPGTGLEAHHPLTAKVSVVRELYSPAAERSCVHVEIDIAGSQLTYVHGDHLAVHAQNAPEVRCSRRARLQAGRL